MGWNSFSLPAFFYPFFSRVLPLPLSPRKMKLCPEGRKPDEMGWGTLLLARVTLYCPQPPLLDFFLFLKNKIQTLFFIFISALFQRVKSGSFRIAGEGWGCNWLWRKVCVRHRIRRKFWGWNVMKLGVPEEINDIYTNKYILYWSVVVQNFCQHSFYSWKFPDVTTSIRTVVIVSLLNPQRNILSERSWHLSNWVEWQDCFLIFYNLSRHVLQLYF